MFDLRTGTGEAHGWAAFNGPFNVDAGGKIALPLIGEVTAAGTTTAALAAAVAARVQAKVGLTQPPDASVQVIKYRPFYIMGAVERPGEYDYRPGLSVLQAVSIAGGMVRPRDGSLLAFEREALAQRGDLRALGAEREALALRQARIDAEVAGADAMVLPADTGRAGREERLLFDTRRTALKAQVDAIEKSKVLLQQELTSLEAKDAAAARQIEAIGKELSQVNGLVSRGLAPAPRQFAVEQSVAAFESNRVDVQVARLRALQDLSRADREIIDLRARRRSDILTEAAEVRARLAAVTEKMRTATGLIHQAEVRSPLAMAAASVEEQPTYVLSRRVDDGARTLDAVETSPVEPGDVVRVLVPRTALVGEGDAARTRSARGDEETATR